MAPTAAPRRRVALTALAAVVVGLSCGREPTGAAFNALHSARFNLAPRFPEPMTAVRSQGLVPVDRVRIVFRHDDGSMALDTVVFFPAGQDSIALTFAVPLSATAPLSGEPLKLSLGFVNTAGDTVFRGGPLTVTAVPASVTGAPAPTVEVPVSYTGPGATASRVVITPRTQSAFAGAAFAYTAVAYDGSGSAMPTAPIVWRSLDSTRARLTTASAGSGTAQSQRGPARIVASLLTGPSDTVVLAVLATATSMSKQSGDLQTGLVGSTLTAPLAVSVLGSDGLGVSGTTVTFSIATGGGTVASASAVSDSTGTAKTTWKLGSLLGTQTATATVAGLTGSPLTFSATAVAGAASQLSFTALQAVDTAGLPFGATVTARDSLGNVATSFTGAVTLSMVTNPLGDTLTGTLTRSAVAGIATFTGLGLKKAADTLRLGATATGITSATSSRFVLVAAAAKTLSLVSGGNQTAAVGAVLNSVTVRTVDPFGNPTVQTPVSYAVATGGGSVTPTTQNTTTAGLSSASWTLGPAGGAQTLTVSSSGLTGSPLTVSATATTVGVKSIVVSPRADTISALGESHTLTATVVADSGVAKTVTWLSRDPAIATVNGSGVVTAIANGITTIVATTITGGLQDSARVFVVQFAASITVTPSSRSVYQSRTVSFTASAVDGRGNPMPSTTTFAWTSLAPSIATVDANGVVTGVSVGSAQIRAVSGSGVGVATVNVLSLIKRIVVTRDSTGAVAPDTVKLSSLGLTKTFRAVARDSLDAPMTGITFVWASTNGSVAALDSVTATTARATAAANGTTAITATAAGVSGSALLIVQQQLAAIELSPTAVSVAAGGTTALVARGKDANGRYISGGTFTYSTTAASVATVSSTGIVTGVGAGTADIKASSSAIQSNASTVTVGGSVPAKISFGRDTLSVGRGTTVSIPILLSKPNGTAVTVNLAVRDTFAFFSAASVTIPAGTTSINATLTGRNAGTTRVVATDGSGTGFAADSSVLAVTATLRLTNSSYRLNATDQLATQVLLSDPSPAGGTYVPFTASVSGKVSVSPDPAFIPQGQLAADIIIRGVAAGTLSLTPTALGVNGTASSVTVSAAALKVSPTSLRLGNGQFESGIYVYLPEYTSLALPVTLTSSDTMIATVQPTATIPSNSYYQYFTVSAKGVGTATITASATDWTAFAVPVRVTTPAVGVSGGGTLNVTSGSQSVVVYAEDSTRSVHTRTNSLAVRLSSSDTTVLKVLDTLVTIGAGQYYASGARVQPAGLGGTAYLKATASGHISDSTLYTVIAPKLEFSWGSARIGIGQQDEQVYVYAPNNVSAPLTVTITNPDSSKLGVPLTVTIPQNSYYSYFTVRGKATGAVSLIASAAGYRGDTASYVVTSPRVTLSGGGTLNALSAPQAFTTYAADSTRTAHTRSTPLVVSFASTDTTVLKVDATATIDSGKYFASTPKVTAVAGGTAKVVATATGHFPDTVSYTVQSPKLRLNVKSYRIGARQKVTATEFYVYTPDNVSAALGVTLTQKRSTVASLTASSLTIPAGSYYQYFSFAALIPGVDTIIATASGYLPDTSYIIVTTPKFTTSGLPGTATTTNAPATVVVYAADSVGTAHYASDTVVVRAVSSDSAVIKPVQKFFRILKGEYYAQPTVSFVGTGTASITYSDSAGTGYVATTTNTVTVSGPSLTLSGGTIVLGMRQKTGPSDYYVYLPNNTTSALTVNLASSSTRVATVPASVTIAAGTYYAYFTVVAQDTLGTIQIQATATGYNAATRNVQVTQPKFVLSTGTQLNTTSPASAITVYAADANGTSHLVAENVTVTLASSAPTVASIDSASVVIRAGEYYSQGASWKSGSAGVGTAQLSAADSRAVFYKYSSATANVAVIKPSLSLSWSSTVLGIGQYLDQYVATPDYQSAALAVTLSRIGTARTSTPSSVTIATSNYYSNFRLVGLSAGVDTIVSAASGHNSDSAYTTVGVGRIDPISNWPTSVKAGDSVQVTLYTRDPSQNIRYVSAATTFTLAPNANIVFKSGGSSSATITSVVVPADAYSVNFYIKGVASGTGSATITSTNYQSYTNSVTVSP